MTIPSTIRVPLFYAEMDNSMAGTCQQAYRALLIGQSLKLAEYNAPRLTPSESQAIDLYGEGSMLAEMVKAYRRNDSFMEIWTLPLADADAGVAATGTITFTGPAQETGVLYLYIAGKRVTATVVNADTAETIASAVTLAINSYTGLPVTAEASDAAVTLTCKWKGATGNDIDLRLNYLGETGGEKTPAGLTVNIVGMAGGALNPEVLEGLANLGDMEFDYIALPYSDAANLNQAQEFMDDNTGRWSWSQQLYGHVFVSIRAGVAQAQTVGATRNDQHCSILPYNGSPTPPWEVTAFLAAQCGQSLSNDPAQPVQFLTLTGMQAPDVADRFILTERNTLLYNGMSTFNVVSGICQTERIITTYQKNAAGTADNSYLDVETMATSAYVLRSMRQRITSRYGRHKLADDSAILGPGQKVVQPKTIKAELIALYAELEYAGIVENGALFAQHLIVERDANDPNRINVLFPADYVNQLCVFAVINQFRLNY